MFFSENYVLALAAILGIATHLPFHTYEPRSTVIPLILLLIEPWALILTSLPPSGMTIRTISTIYIIFLFSLALSVVAYRLSPFHPLAQFPGPLIYKVSKLRGMYGSWRGHLHLDHKRLHDKYGPFVRTGPNELSIVEVDAVTTILGANGLPKGRYYDARQDPTAPRNLVVLRGEEHANRRRLWNRGMSTDSLRNYEVLIANRAQQLVERLEKAPGVVDLAKWLSFFSFDFMGDMAFGGGSEMLRDAEDKAGLWNVLENFMFTACLVSHIPWASRTLQCIPSVARDLQTLRKFGVSCATSRVKSGATVKDLWYHLTDDAGLEKEKPPVSNVVADGALAVIAGADTTATAIASLFYFLLSNPEAYKKLQSEVDAVHPYGEDALDTSKSSNMPFLGACINETLRLQPPVPTNGTRRVPSGSGGKVVAGRFIPEGTEVYVPAYSLHRDARYFSPSPNEFQPERWLAREQTQHLNKAAFIPFSFGPSNCVGRNLAKQEIMMVASLLLQTFEIRFGDGVDSRAWERGLEDHLVLKRTELPVVLTPRH